MATEPVRFELREHFPRGDQSPAPFRKHGLGQGALRNPALQGNPQQSGNCVAIRRKLVDSLDQCARHSEQTRPGVIQVDTLEPSGDSGLNRQYNYACAAGQRGLCLCRGRQQAIGDHDQLICRINQTRHLTRACNQVEPRTMGFRAVLQRNQIAPDAS